MTVRLKGINFDIKPIHDENRLLQNGKSVPWSWEVTPEKSGDQTLILTVYARIPLSGESQELVDLETFERKIKVTVSKSNWFKQNWMPIIEITIALGGTGFFAFIVTRWKLVKSVLKR